MNLTPIDEAVFNAQELAAGIAAMALVQDLIKKGFEASAVSENLSLDILERKKAMKDHKHINMLLNFIAQTRASIGISA
jgi:hypothetical protein